MDSRMFSGTFRYEISKSKRSDSSNINKKIYHGIFSLKCPTDDIPSKILNFFGESKKSFYESEGNVFWYPVNYSSHNIDKTLTYVIKFDECYEVNSDFIRITNIEKIDL